MPFLALLAGGAIIFAIGLADEMQLAGLRRHHGALLAWVERGGTAAVLVFVMVYAGVVAFCVPGAMVLTLVAGLLFGAVFATLYVVVAATLGAALLFLAARSALGNVLRTRAGGAVRRMEDGFRANAFSYLLFLRLVPIFPFFLVNLAPAFLGIRLSTFVTATFIGIIPGTFVYANIGAGLGVIFAAGGDVQIETMLTPEVMIALSGLGLLSLAPMLVRRARAMRQGS